MHKHTNIRCGADEEWRWPTYQLPKDYYTFPEPPDPPRPLPVNSPGLEKLPAWVAEFFYAAQLKELQDTGMLP